MLTGGEPTIHPKLPEIVQALDFEEISITSNGIRPFSEEYWRDLADRGLTKLIVSMHDASAPSFLSLESRTRSMDWALRSMEAQKSNLVNASRAGLVTRVNAVAYRSAEHALEVLRSLKDLQQEFGIEVRLLNDLTKTAESQEFILRAIELLEAEERGAYRRAGSSNVTKYFRCPSGFEFSVKVAHPYFFGPVCDGCALKRVCFEGFYGVRVERRADGYYVRLCIYKQSSDVLMPWRQFLQSKIITSMTETMKDEQLGF